MTDTQAIKDRVDIVQLISEYIQLKKAGANWKANCPFHHEKTPSFMVHPEKQIWHCFGCQKGGDVFSFLQEMEGLDFPEALKILADRAGVKIDTLFASEVNKSQRNRIIEINAKAAYFFHHFLLEMPAAQKAREYLDGRKLKKETIEDWQIGFISDQWDLLTRYLLKKGFGIDDLIASGLTIKKEGANVSAGKGYYDRFRGRIMFPIWDTHGNVAGFTGRILVETEKSGGKYINTPQTLVFDKSRLLYGLNKAKIEIKNKDLAVLVEGQMDVIACHQAGMKNVVASSGTALTFEQVKLLKRYSNNIAMAFDADLAGQNAAKRGVDVALEQGMNIKIIQIPADCGKDADECLKKDTAVWFQAVSGATEAMEWYFSSVLSGINGRDPKQKQKAVETLLPEIARLPFATERDHWLKILADKLGVEANLLREGVKRRLKKAAISQSGGVLTEEQDSWVEGEKGYSLRVENLWSLFIKFPKLLPVYKSSLTKEYFAATPFLSLYDLIGRQYNNGDIDVAEISKALAQREGENPVDLLLLRAEKDFLDFTEEDAKKEIADLLAQIKMEWVRRRRKELNEELKKTQEEKNEPKIAEILQAIMELNE